MKAPKRLHSFAPCIALLIASGLITLPQQANAEKAPLTSSKQDGPVRWDDSPLNSERVTYADSLIDSNRLAEADQFLREPLANGTAIEEANAKIELLLLEFGSEGWVAGRYAVTHLGGYQGGWIVVATRDSEFSRQRMSRFSPRFPRDWIRQQWKEGFRITTLSGDQSGWCVVMSLTVDQKAPIQRYFGPAPVNWAMEEWIKQQAQEGLRITSVGGFGGQWVVVMTADTGWGAQRYLTPGRSEAEIAAWWETRQAEGYSITAMNGNFVFDKETRETTEASFFIVATEGLNLAPQRLEVAVTRPKSGEINTDAPVRIIAGYGKNTDPFIVLRGGFLFEGSRQMISVGADCDKLIRQVWDEFHELDEIAKQQKKNSGE